MVPLWLKFPNLPLNFWREDLLSRISSGLGNSINVDACTTRVERISYARIFIDMDVTGPLPQVVKVKDPFGKVFDQECGMIRSLTIVMSACK